MKIHVFFLKNVSHVTMHILCEHITNINMSLILVSSSAKCIATQIEVIEKLNGREDLVLRGCVYDMIFPSN